MNRICCDDGKLMDNSKLNIAICWLLNIFTTLWMTDIKLPKLVQLTVPMTPIAYDVKRQN
jgi:hypothetical protein